MIETVIAEEKQYNFTSFSHQDAFFIGQYIVAEIERLHEKPVRIRVVIQGDIVFQYLMDGKKGELWLNKKQKTVEKFQHSSYYIYLQNEKNHQYDDLQEDYAICGGGFPLFINGTFSGCICVSGLQHDQDHQLIINALSWLTEKKKPAHS